LPAFCGRLLQFDGSCSPPCAVRLKSFSLYLLLSHSIKSRLPFFSGASASFAICEVEATVGQKLASFLLLSVAGVTAIMLIADLILLILY